LFYLLKYFFFLYCPLIEQYDIYIKIIDKKQNYLDNLTSIKVTLNIIKELEHINWLVKPHPNDIKNNGVNIRE